ncbi:MAG: minor capsid protein [Oscillospiraceae bacterium]|nr:minor capsid protein [Oscillospiraceae bacterium]
MIRFTKAKATPPKPKKPKGRKKAALNKLKAFLAQAEPETVEILVSNFNAQRNAVTYKELREAYLAGGITQKQFEKWQQDYAKLITSTLAPKWEMAAAAAAQEVKDRYPRFIYEPSVSAGMDFIRQHGAELVTNLAAEQRAAVNAVIAHVSGYTAVTPDEAARIIRPCVGLTKPQAVANARYREKVKNSVYEAHRKAHPHGNPDKAAQIAERKAQEAAARYAAHQHRYRAQNIARTELAFAYNAGAYGATKDAQAQGYIGDCVKVWLTAYDERVCPICSAMDDEKRNMDETFSNGKMLPPGHPSCRCAVAYEEIPGTNLNTALTEPPESGIIETVKPAISVEYRQFETGDAVNSFFYWDGEERGLKGRKSSLHGKWFSGLSPDEDTAIRSYTANGYSDINRYWRRVDGWETIPAGKARDPSKQIDAAISRFHLKENITVQRGLDDFYGSSLVEAKEWNDIHEIVGMTYQDLGYGSSTVLMGNRVATAKPYLLEIDIPAGTGRGAYVNKFAGQYEDKEFEFLIARGSKFEITDVVINEEPIPPQTIIKMRMIVDE